MKRVAKVVFVFIIPNAFFIIHFPLFIIWSEAFFFICLKLGALFPLKLCCIVCIVASFIICIETLLIIGS